MTHVPARTEIAAQGADTTHPFSWSKVPNELMSCFSKDLSPNEKTDFMRRAIEAAKNSPYFPSPTVGAVLVVDGEILALDHRRFETVCKNGVEINRRIRIVHAEQGVLESIPNRVAGATLYTTLEPCFERGYAPILTDETCCSELILRAGIERVVIGLVDADPRTQGKGVRYLVERGIKVEYVMGELESELLELIGNGRFQIMPPGDQSR